MRPELVDVTAAALHQALALAWRPVPSFSLSPYFVVDDHLVPILRVRLQSRHPAEVARLGEARGGKLAVRGVDVDARAAVRRRPGADALAPWRMHVAEVMILDDLPFLRGAR